MLKKWIYICAVLLLPFISEAQRIAYVDTDYILSKIETYGVANQTIEQYAKKWQQEVDTKYKEVDAMYKKYQAEEFLLTADLKKQREDEIINKEKEAADLQKKYFSPEGEMFKKRKELIQPIQEKVFASIEKIATNLGYDFIFDKAATSSPIIFSNPKFDLSDQVLKSLQIN
jgi:outer membrane protein